MFGLSHCASVKGRSELRGDWASIERMLVAALLTATVLERAPRNDARFSPGVGAGSKNVSLAAKGGGVIDSGHRQSVTAVLLASGLLAPPGHLYRQVVFCARLSSPPGYYFLPAIFTARSLGAPVSALLPAHLPNCIKEHDQNCDAVQSKENSDQFRELRSR